MTDPMQLHALADGELDRNEAQALRDALRHDGRANAELDSILNLKDALAKHSVRHTNDEAWKACVRRLDGIDKSRRVEGFVGRYAWAMCGALFLFILSGRIAMRNFQGETTLAADIIRFSGSAATPGVQAKAKDILKLATTGVNTNRIEQRDFATAGVHNGYAAERIPLRDNGGDLDLLHVDGPLEVPDALPMLNHMDLSVAVAEGQNCVVWHNANGTWVLSGKRAFEDLAQVATRISGAH